MEGVAGPLLLLLSLLQPEVLEEEARIWNSGEEGGESHLPRRRAGASASLSVQPDGVQEEKKIFAGFASLMKTRPGSPIVPISLKSADIYDEY